MRIAILRSFLGLCLFFALFIGTASPAFGQSAPGVSENEILIGSCSALEGASHFLGVETVTGAKAYFNLINEEGGVNAPEAVPSKPRGLRARALGESLPQYGQLIQFHPGGAHTPQRFPMRRAARAPVAQRPLIGRRPVPGIQSRNPRRRFRLQSTDCCLLGPHRGILRPLVATSATLCEGPCSRWLI